MLMIMFSLVSGEKRVYDELKVQTRFLTLRGIFGVEFIMM